MDALFSQNYRALLEANGLGDFNSFWHLPENWVEPPNKRRGGWSGVSTTQLTQGNKAQGNKAQTNTEPLTLFIKRQHTHTFRSLKYPFSKSTAWREYQNNLRMKSFGFPVATTVFYQEQKHQGEPRAVMATIGISDPIPLNKWLAIKTLAETAIDAVLLNIARDLCKLHDLGFEYRALFGSHILLSDYQSESIPQHFFIDLETVRRQVPHLAPRVRDICQLFRRTPSMTEKQRAFFLEQYLADSPTWAKRFRNHLLKRMGKKNSG